MRKFLLTTCLFCGFLTLSTVFAGNSNVTISSIEKTKTPPTDASALSSMNVKHVETLLGRKLSFKEKVALKVYKWKEKNQLKAEEGGRSKRGKTAMILGIIAVGVLFIPYAAIATIPLGILAIVFGNQAKKADPNDGQAKAGVILGWVALGLVVLAIIVALAFLSLYSW